MEVDFYTLERAVQDRFVDATRAIGLPTPIVREKASSHALVYWWLGAAAALIVLGALVFRGVGNLGDVVAIAPPAHAALYAVCAALFAFCALRGLGIRSARKSLPYEPGLYLFPSGVFDARGELLRVFRHTELRQIELQGAMLRVSAGAVAFDFRFPDAATAEAARAALHEASRRYDEAVKQQNLRDEAMLDPLVDSGFSSPFSSHQRLMRKQPLWLRVGSAVAIAAACGAVVGPALWKVRNVVSEQRLYKSARAANDVASYRAYIDRGGTRTEVSDILLPRAELRIAVSAGTVEALEAYVVAHPASKIEGEVQAALRAAVGADLSAARKAGTVRALRVFQHKRSRYAFIAPTFDLAMTETFRRSLDAFVAGKDPGVSSFYERLLGYSKAHGPEILVRFVRRLPESVARADESVKRSAYFMGNDSIPSQYFIGAYADQREAPAAKQLAEIITSGFPPDVLSARAAPTLTDVGEMLPEPTVPTLYVDYSPEMSGGFMSPKPRGVFVGIGMTFKATFRIPGDAQPLEYKFSAWRAPNPLILKNEGAKIADVYERIASDSFEKFLKGFSQLITGK